MTQEGRQEIPVGSEAKESTKAEGTIIASSHSMPVDLDQYQTFERFEATS